MLGPGRRIQIWSYNYAPEPTGIGPVSSVLAHALRDAGHRVDVVAAHPHYPDPVWGRALRPYREIRDGIGVLRLPLWIGRASGAERVRQEASFMLAQTAAIPLLGRPDLTIAVSPSFPALLPAILSGKLRSTPWVLWLHDILPDAASATGLLDESSLVIRASRVLERSAYRNADEIVVLSSAFAANLTAKRVPADKLTLIYDPATREPRSIPPVRSSPTPRLLCMGNIGFSQGLAPLVRAIEADPDAAGRDVRLVLTGDGVAAADVRAEIRTDRIEMLGLVNDDTLERELMQADIGLVTQHYEGAEFNIPSKIMNYMAYGLPVLAAVNPAGEVAHIVRTSGGGWVVDSSDPEALPRAIRAIAADPADQLERSRKALAYAEANFTVKGFAEQFGAVIERVLGRPRDAGARAVRNNPEAASQ